MWTFRLIFIAGIAIATVQARPITSDSERGEKLFSSESCIQCHGIAGSGGSSARDFGKRLARNYSPALMARVMWNHAPSMEEMSAKNIEWPRFTARKMSD